MKAVIIAAMLLAALPAGAWDKVYEGTGVSRFVERGGRLWALPGLSSSTDHGRNWSAALDIDDSRDSDISNDSRKASIGRYSHLYLETLEGEDLIAHDAPRLAAWGVRFLGKSVLAIGSMRDGDDERESALLSRDNGTTWDAVLPKKISALAEPFVLDERRAWIASEDDAGPVVVWRTSDGGKSWERSDSVPPIFGSCDAVHFIDKKRGWLVTASAGTKSVYATDDGGDSWEQRGAIAVSTIGALSLAFAGKKTGWAAAPGALWKTVDGGKTWTPQELPTQVVPDGVGLHYGEDKQRGYLLYATSTAEFDAEDERIIGSRGEIYRLEVDRP